MVATLVSQKSTNVYIQKRSYVSYRICRCKGTTAACRQESQILMSHYVYCTSITTEKKKKSLTYYPLKQNCPSFSSTEILVTNYDMYTVNKECTVQAFTESWGRLVCVHLILSELTQREKHFVLNDSEATASWSCSMIL